MKLWQVVIKFIIMFILCVVAISMILLAGCGNNNAPSSGTITFNPSSYSAGLASNTCVPFVMTIKDSNGNPLNHINFTLYGPFAFPRVPTRYEIWSQPSCASGSGSEQDGTLGLSGQTGNDGTYTFSLNIYSSASGTFSDTLTATSGAVFGSLGVATQ